MLCVVVPTCNFSYLKGRDQEDCGLRPALAKSVKPYLKNKIQNKKRNWTQWLTPVILAA
jgi:hypothetical protein